MIGALLDPFSLADTAWQLNAPSPADGNREWWPQVHIRRERPLTQIPSGQVALLRRDTLVRLAFATELSHATELRAGEAARLSLISSPAPGSVRTLLQHPIAPSRSPLVLTSDLDASPTLLALEVQAASDAVGDARTRFGVVPPPTLQAMNAGGIALSDPVFLSPDSGDGLVSNIDSLLHDRMLGSLHISTSAGPRVDVFWESYGVRAEDSARVSVRVERQQRLGGFHRLAIAMRLRDDPNATVTVRWRDTPALNAPGTAASARDGRRESMAGVPVHARAITLDLSRLSAGSLHAHARSDPR